MNPCHFPTYKTLQNVQYQWRLWEKKEKKARQKVEESPFCQACGYEYQPLRLYRQIAVHENRNKSETGSKSNCAYRVQLQVSTFEPRNVNFVYSFHQIPDSNLIVYKETNSFVTDVCFNCIARVCSYYVYGFSICQMFPIPDVMMLCSHCIEIWKWKKNQGLLVLREWLCLAILPRHVRSRVHWFHESKKEQLWFLPLQCHQRAHFFHHEAPWKYNKN